MKEIGGYFGLEQFVKNEYYPDLIALNNGRNALLYLLKARKISKIYLPCFLCESVANMCNRYGYEYEHYHISDDFMPIFDKPLKNNEYLYVVNYYGQISNETVVGLKNKYKNIIFDNVQAFFQKPVKGIDTIYSCRKFFGVPDGSYLSTDAVLDSEVETDISKDRMKHILGRFEGVASDYYNDFKDNDKSFADEELKYMSALTRNLLGAIDYEAARTKRNENYALLDASLGKINKLNLTTPDGPYCYPFYCEKGLQVKKQLAQQKIYVATLWPNVLDMDNSLEKDYAENILPIPCDQRYGKEDMLRIIKELNNILGEIK